MADRGQISQSFRKEVGAKFFADSPAGGEAMITSKKVGSVSALALMLGFVTAGETLAQDSNEVVVTGTRIRGEAPVGSTVTTIGREDIESSGAVTTTYLLQQVPQIFNLGISENSRAQSGGSSNITNGSSPNLRGIGTFATLVMMDGHRIVPQGTSGFAVDPGTLPTLALQRLEVVADGASAIYGSDAVAGVINMVLRRNFEGLEVDGRYGAADGYDEYNYGFITGKSWSRGNFTFAYENGTHSDLQGKDRSFFGLDLSANGGPDKRTTQCNPGTITVGGKTYAIPTGGVSVANASALVAGTKNLCDLSGFGDIIGRQARNSATFTFDQEINGWLSLYADGFVSERRFNQLSGYAGTTVTIPASNPFFVLPPGVTATSESVNFAYSDYAPSYTAGFSRAWNATLGARIQLPQDWKIETDYTYGADLDRSDSYNALNNTNQAAAINSTNSATALNPFSKTLMSDALVQNIFNGIFVGKGGSSLGVASAKADGPVFSLPAGEVRAAVGYENQIFDVRQSPITGNMAAPVQKSTSHSRVVNSGYAEILVPIFGEANAMPLFQKLDLDLAFRYDDYSDVGPTSNPKYGINWSPTKGVMFRGSYGTSFRAPGIAQIFGNTNNLYFFTNQFDPTVGTNVNAAIRSGPNLNIKPETATTWTLGADFDPAPGLNLSLTYWSYDYAGQVTAFLSDRQSLRFEQQLTAAGLVVRNPSQAFINQQLAEVDGVSGAIIPVVVWVDGRNFNGGRSVTEGVDLKADYHLATERSGEWSFGFNGTYLTKYETEIIAGAPAVDALNTIYNPMRFKARGSVTWQGGPVTANVFVNYINSYTNNVVTPSETIPSFTSLDLRLAYGFGEPAKPLTLAVDVRNAFDKAPPYANTGFGFDPTQVNPVGRVIGISLDKKF
jgi:iron complex outermembrane recepter protein